MQTPVIMSAQSVVFVGGFLLSSRQNASRATESSVQSVSNGLSRQMPVIVSAQSSVLVSVILVLSRQNACRATGSAVQSPLNGLLSQSYSDVGETGMSTVLTIISPLQKLSSGFK